MKVNVANVSLILLLIHQNDYTKPLLFVDKPKNSTGNSISIKADSLRLKKPMSIEKNVEWSIRFNLIFIILSLEQYTV